MLIMAHPHLVVKYGPFKCSAYFHFVISISSIANCIFLVIIEREFYSSHLNMFINLIHASS